MCVCAFVCVVQVDECHKRLKAERNRAEEELSNKKDRFVEELDEYVRQAEAFSAYGEIDRVQEHKLELTSLQANHRLEPMPPTPCHPLRRVPAMTTVARAP